MKRDKIIYFVVTGILSLLTAMSVGMYLFNHEHVTEVFVKLGYPAYIIYPLAIAKSLGLVAIWTRKSVVLKEWAYAGFFFDFILATSAHIAISDGEFAAALVAAVLLLVSYFYGKKAFA